MSNNPWLSVLIPVYNVEEYVAECVHSVLAQCDSQVEVLLLDDKSTDESLRILNRMNYETDCSVRILKHDQNKGLSAARNSLLKEAKGRYIWFIDSDDVLVEGCVSKLKYIVEQNSPDMVLCDYSIWRPGVLLSEKQASKESHISTFNGIASQLSYCPSKLFEGIFRRGKMHACFKVFKRKLWNEDNLFPVGKYYEDIVSIPRVALRAKSYYYCADVWVKYRQRPGSILATPSIKKIHNMVEALRDILPLWLSRYPSLSYSAKFQYYCFCLRVYGFTVKDLKRLEDGCSVKRNDVQSLFYSVIGMGRAEFCKIFLLRGDLLRTYRFIRWTCQPV